MKKCLAFLETDTELLDINKLLLADELNLVELRVSSDSYAFLDQNTVRALGEADKPTDRERYEAAALPAHLHEAHLLYGKSLGL